MNIKIEGHQRQIQDFIDSIREKRPFFVEGDAKRAMRSHSYGRCMSLRRAGTRHDSPQSDKKNSRSNGWIEETAITVRDTNSMDGAVARQGAT
jgi:hypothetical protein